MDGISHPKPCLDVDDLRIVLALAETGSTVRASSVLHLAQSAVSRGLLAVEAKLETRLFERQARGLLPTSAGRRLIGGAGEVLARLVDLEEQVRTGKGGEVPLRVVCECYTAYRWLPASLASLRATMPQLDITVSLEHTPSPVKALLTKEVDVALLTMARVTGTVVEEPLFSDEIVFVIAATHPLARRPSIGVDALKRYPLISSTATPEPERQWFQRQVFGRTLPRLEGFRFPLTETVIDAARAGMGVAPMSEWVARAYLGSGDLVVKPFRGKRLMRPWRIAYRPETKARAKMLAAALAGSPPSLLRTSA
ncbi:MAG: LysR family transcriptional regulator [Polyangiaceae bacterium]